MTPKGKKKLRKGTEPCSPEKESVAIIGTARER